MAEDRGAIKRTLKVADGDDPIAVPTGTWTTAARFTLDDVGRLPLGWSVLDGELYSGRALGYGLPATLPKSIQARWLRHVGREPADPTKRTGLVVAERDWAAVVPAAIEYLTPADFPLELQIRSSGTLWYLTTVVAAILAPATYAASRLTIGAD